MLMRLDTFDGDLAELDRTLGMARHPPGLLKSRIWKLRERIAVGPSTNGALRTEAASHDHRHHWARRDRGGRGRRRHGGGGDDLP